MRVVEITDIEAVNAANVGNAVQVPFSLPDGRVVIVDNRDDPAWTGWWERFTGDVVGEPFDPDAAKHEDIAALRAEVAALRTALVAAQVIDDAAIAVSVEQSKDREIALARLAAVSGMSREELLKLEAGDPDVFAQIVEKFGVEVPTIKEGRR